MFDNGIGIECYGGVHHINRCKLEKCILGIWVNGDRNLYRMSGRGNRIFGGTYSHLGSGGGFWLKMMRDTHISNPHFVWIGEKNNGQGHEYPDSWSIKFIINWPRNLHVISKPLFLI